MSKPNHTFLVTIFGGLSLSIEGLFANMDLVFKSIAFYVTFIPALYNFVRWGINLIKRDKNETNE
jgi:hypothetical protein